MGKDPGSIEWEIRERRRRAEDRVVGLRHRLGRDVEAVGEQAQQLQASALHEADKAVDIETRVREHPYSTLAIGFGVGACLGALMDGDGKPGGDNRRTENGGSALSGLMGSLAGFTAETFGTELKSMLREGISEFISSMKRDRTTTAP